jgi:hypothetical protein
MNQLSDEGAMRLESVADETTGAWLDALPVTSNCRLENGDVLILQYMLGVWPAAMQDRPMVGECGKEFSPGQAVRCNSCASVCAACGTRRALISPFL